MTNRLPLNGDVAGGEIAFLSQGDLDQLVDDDLVPAQRRRVLATLADQPDGWRRCALAFLEAQSWRRACRQLAAESPAPAAAAPSPASTQRRRHKLRTAATIGAIAAALGLVFLGGLAAGRAWPTAPGQAGAALTAQGAVGDHAADGNRKEERMVMHVLGFINVQGEDGARHAVPILAAPGLKVDAPLRPATTLAAGEPPGDSSAPRGGFAQPLMLPLSPGRSVVISANVLTIAQGQPIY